MDIVRFVNENIDPFLVQLVIVPFLAVSLGVFIGVKTRKFLAAPIITLLVFSAYSNIFLNSSEMDGLHIEFIVTSLVLSLLFKSLMPTEVKK